MLDLDETLLHSSFKVYYPLSQICAPPASNHHHTPLPRMYKLTHSPFSTQLIPQADYIVPVEIEGQTHNVYVIKRPGVDEFLRRMGEIYEVVIFTASLSKVRPQRLFFCDLAVVCCLMNALIDMTPCFRCYPSSRLDHISTPTRSSTCLTSTRSLLTVSSERVATTTRATTSRFATSFPLLYALPAFLFCIHISLLARRRTSLTHIPSSTLFLPTCPSQTGSFPTRSSHRRDHHHRQLPGVVHFPPQQRRPCLDVVQRPA